MSVRKRVLIIGGGFSGVTCALHLARLLPTSCEVVLVSNTNHFEYHAALYRVVAGHSPLEVCIPLSEIFADERVQVVEDTITSIDLNAHSLRGDSGSRYTYDYLVLALGSETTYYDTPGLNSEIFTIKTTSEALRLKRHLHTILASCAYDPQSRENLCKSRILVVGGGPTGTELAGELAVYVRKLAREHAIDPSLVTIDLVQSPNRLVPQLPSDISSIVEQRLRSLGVNVYLNRRLLGKQLAEAKLSDMSLQSNTIVWTAGVKAHSLYRNSTGLVLSRGGRVSVTPHLRARGQRTVFVVGDGADTEFSGLAQTAIFDGRYVAQVIYSEIIGGRTPKYKPSVPINAVPVGPGWAVVEWCGYRIQGKLGWWLRRALDFWVFMQVLPLSKAWQVFQTGSSICEFCPVCSQDSKQKSDAIDAQ